MTIAKWKEDTPTDPRKYMSTTCVTHEHETPAHKAHRGLRTRSQGELRSKPKLRRPGCVDPWLTRGFAGLVGWWFWLRGGQGYRGANEFESAALVGGGFGEGGHLGVGAVVADLVAGEGGQVIEQAAEAAQ